MPKCCYDPTYIFVGWSVWGKGLFVCRGRFVCVSGRLIDIYGKDKICSAIFLTENKASLPSPREDWLSRGGLVLRTFGCQGE